MRNFQGSIFIRTKTYREIFKSALAYLEQVNVCWRKLFTGSNPERFTCSKSTIKKLEEGVKYVGS